MITVLEKFVMGKQPNKDLCEDLIYADEWFGAVVDGATDKTGATYDGLAGGRFAAAVIAEALSALDPRATAREAVDMLTGALAEHVEGGPADRPSAAVTIYSDHRREVWQVGDVSWTTCGGVLRAATRKDVDVAAAGVRSALLQSLLNEGMSFSELSRSDPGREAILPLLESQYHLRNATGRWSYGALDGTRVPDRHVGVFAVPSSETQLAIYTDGYPQPACTLAEAEIALASGIDADPLCIGELMGTKGLRPGNVSFDDRAYLLMEIGSTPARVQ